MTVRSMTGFGSGDARVGSDDAATTLGKVSVEVRAVNHRYLDLRVRVPAELPDLVSTVESLARERLTRGRFDIVVRLDGAGFGKVSIDRDRARSVFSALTELRDELAPGSDVPLSLLAAIPDLFVSSLERDREHVTRAIVQAFETSLVALDAMREREGAMLVEDFTRRLGAVRRHCQAIATRGPLVIDAYTKRLKKRAERLRTAADVELDPTRLEQEVALYADRIDISEELTRLESHSAQFEALLARTEPVGRRLDFLLQEMAREANTIGSKSQDVEIAHAVVELKAEIENMREQSQNIE